MLVNYLVIFVLLVFNEFYSIGTIMYTTINIAFLLFLTMTSMDIIKKLKRMLAIARNQRYPERALKVKIELMTRSMALIAIFFVLEIIYHGVLSFIGIPSNRNDESMFYIFHETTDFIIIAILLYVLKTQEYIPYFGVLNLDAENPEQEEIEFQRFNDVETLNFQVSSDQYR